MYVNACTCYVSDAAFTCMCVNACTCMYLTLHLHVCMYVNACTCYVSDAVFGSILTYAYVNIHASPTMLFAHKSIHLFMHAYVTDAARYIHIHTHTYIHTPMPLFHACQHKQNRPSTSTLSVARHIPQMLIHEHAQSHTKSSSSNSTHVTGAHTTDVDS